MFERESSLTWYPINADTRVEHVKKIRITDVNYSDSNLGLGLWKDKTRIFSTSDMPLRIVNDYMSNIHNAIAFEMD